MNSGPRTRLRSATREAHDALEDLPIMHRLLSPLVTEADYRALLSHLHLAFDAYCPLLAENLGPLAHTELSPVDLPAFLETDLRAMNCWPPAGMSLLDPPPPESPARALGAWYVLEGSALGGVVIATQLRDALGQTLPVTYLAEREAGPESRWQRFDDFFEALLGEEQVLQGVIEGAVSCYRYTASIMARATD